MPLIKVYVKEGMLAEIEDLVDHGNNVWDNAPHFLIEAIDEKIKKTWKGPRYYQGQTEYKGEPPEYEEGN